MGRAQRRGRAVAIGLSVAAHAGVLAVLAFHAPRLRAPPPPPAGPPVAIIPLLLSPRAAPAEGRAGGAGAIRLHRRQVRPRDLPPHVAPLLAPAPAAPVQGPSPPAASGAAPPAAAAGTTADPNLSAALRSRLGCANLQSLSRAERAACEERLGRGAAQAAYIPAPIDPAKRAYYDAVAAAKAPDPPLTPQGAPGRLGVYDTDHRGMKGHGPQIGCSLKFGHGEKPRGPPNALKLGPCFINPPAGSLSPDVDVAPP